MGVPAHSLLDQRAYASHMPLCQKPFEALALKRRAEDLNMLASLDIERYMRSHFL